MNLAEQLNITLAPYPELPADLFKGLLYEDHDQPELEKTEQDDIDEIIRQAGDEAEAGNDSGVSQDDVQVILNDALYRMGEHYPKIKGQVDGVVDYIAKNFDAQKIYRWIIMKAIPSLQNRMKYAAGEYNVAAGFIKDFEEIISYLNKLG